MTPRLPEPHSRWRLRERLDRLGVSYDAAARAIDVFARAVQGYDPRSPCSGAARIRAAARRMAGSRGWLHVFWFTATLLLAGALLSWISLAIVRRFIPGPVPVVLAVAPGVLVTLTLAGTAAGLARAPVRNASRSWPFAIALAGSAAWVATWLIGVADLAMWFSVGTAVLSAAVTGAAFLAASQPAPRPAGRDPAPARPPRPPRRLLTRQQRARWRLRRHAKRWSSAAHTCGLEADGSTPAGEALNRLLSTGTLGDLPVRDLDAFQVQMLTTLLRYQPDPLESRLRAASERLLPIPAQSIALADRSIRLWPPSTSTATSTHGTSPAAICI
jgi:hypothetical protein